MIDIVGAGFLAVPVTTAGAAYDLCQTLGWKHGLHARPSQAPRFYAAIVVITLVALALNFVGVNPMRALVVAGIVQGVSAPPLLMLVMLMTNDPKVMGPSVNTRVVNVLGWATTLVVFAASAAPIVTWIV